MVHRTRMPRTDLPHNLVRQVGGVWCVLMGDELQPCRLAPVVEEPGTRAEQDRGQIQAEPVDQADVHGLPDDARAAMMLTSLSPAASAARVTAAAIPSVTKVNVVAL